MPSAADQARINLLVGPWAYGPGPGGWIPAPFLAARLRDAKVRWWRSTGVVVCTVYELVRPDHAPPPQEDPSWLWRCGDVEGTAASCKEAMARADSSLRGQIRRGLRCPV